MGRKIAARLRVLLLCGQIALLLAGCLSAAPAHTVNPAVGNLPPGVLLESVFFNVGQADAILVRTPTTVMLVDAGNPGDGAALVKALQDRGVERIDYLVATHPHADHIGGMQRVLESFPVTHFLLPDAQTNTKTYENLLLAAEKKGLALWVPKPGESFSMGEVTVKILAPYSQSSNLNNNSIVLYITADKTRLLLAGDMEKEEEADLLANTPTVPAEVLKVGHHGSITSSTKLFLQAVQPQVAIVTAEKEDSSYPAKAVRKSLEDIGARLFITGEEGDITLRTNGQTIGLSTQKGNKYP